MNTRYLCRKCDGTGWIPYSSETVDGELEEAYRLCPNCYAPRRCLGFKVGRPCSRPATVRYGLGYYCKEHVEVIPSSGSSDDAREAIYYLRYWLLIARNESNRFLETKLSEALSEAETLLGCAYSGSETKFKRPRQ
jgi:hypothetical protein